MLCAVSRCGRHSEVLTRDFQNIKPNLETTPLSVPVLPFLVFSGRFLRWQGDVTTTPFGTSLDDFSLFTELSGQVLYSKKDDEVAVRVQA